MTALSSPSRRSDVQAEVDGRIVTSSGLSWSAVTAGVAGALVTQMLLSLFGLGFGLSSVDPTARGTPSAATFTIGAGVWWVVSGVVASAVGGFLAGRLCNRGRATAAYNGLVSWAVTTLVIVVLLSSAAGSLVTGGIGAASSMLGGAGQLLGGAVKTAAQTAAPALTGNEDVTSGIVDQIKGATESQDPAALRDQAAKAVRAVLTSDSPSDQTLQQAAGLLAQARGIPVDQARGEIGQYREQYNRVVADAQQKAAAATRKAAEATSIAALIAGIALVLGAIAAMVSGRYGASVTTASAQAEA